MRVITQDAAHAAWTAGNDAGDGFAPDGPTGDESIEGAIDQAIGDGGEVVLRAVNTNELMSATAAAIRALHARKARLEADRDAAVAAGDIDGYSDACSRMRDLGDVPDGYDADADLVIYAEVS